MNTIKFYLFFFLAATVFFSCSKDKPEGESIDYSALTEQRIMQVSEQKTISDNDITDLETLLGKVTADTTKQRLTTLLNGVKIIKDFIPRFEIMTTDPDANFQQLYATLEASLNQVTDALPRKAVLKSGLATALSNYNTEEYEYPQDVLTHLQDTKNFIRFSLASFLADNFNVRPIEGKPTRYLRRDIESVDSLFWTSQDKNLPYASLKTFKGLRSLEMLLSSDDTLNLNFMKNTLEHLKIQSLNNKATLNIDSCQRLKTMHLAPVSNKEALSGGNYATIGAATFLSNNGKTWDFTDKFPLLETLSLPATICQNLVTLLLPGKQHLTNITFQGPNGQDFNQLPNIKKIVIEGNGINALSLNVGSASNLELDEISVSGLGSLSGTPGSCGVGVTPGTTEKVKINKLNLSGNGKGFTSVGLGGLKLDKIPDISSLVSEVTTNISFGYSDITEKPNFDNLTVDQLRNIKAISIQSKVASPGSFEDYNSLWQKLNPEALTDLTLPIGSYPNKTADFSRFKKLNRVYIPVTTSSGQILDKLILNKAVQSNWRLYNLGENGEITGRVTTGITVEFKD
ncbi:hypothetical protein [Niabella aquatica]